MTFPLKLTFFSICLAAIMSCANSVRTYNALNPANVLIQYGDANYAGKLLLVTLNSSNRFTKLQGFEESDLQAYMEEQEAQRTGETQQAEGTSRSEPQSANELLRHGKEFIHFIKLYEAMILYGPEDVECYFFTITLDERVMPERSLIRHSRPLRPLRRFSFGETPLKHVVAVECEGSVDWEQNAT